MNMNSKTTTTMFDFFPFMKATAVCSKPLPGLRAVDGKTPICPPMITVGHSIFIIGQSENTVDLLIINQGDRRMTQGIHDRALVAAYLAPLGIFQSDITHLERIGLTWRQMIDELDHARPFQNHLGYLKQFINTLDYRHHVPPSQLDDRPPQRLPSRLIEALTLFPNRVIELVMNDADQGNLEDLLLEIIIRHNIHYGRHKAEHIRRTLNDRTNIRELSELFSQHFRQQLKHQLFILEIIKGVDSYWDLFIWTQLTSFLKDILPTTRVLILNYNSESLNLKDVEVSVFLYQAGLA
jgi:hypothetical protein